MTFHEPPVDLARYFTTFYHVKITPVDAPVVHDALHPEWGNLRIFSGAGPSSAIGKTRLGNARCTLTGPSSVPLHFSMPETELWGMGLLPLGWARFIDQPADGFANSIIDVHAKPAFAAFASLADAVLGRKGQPQKQLDLLHAFFRDAKNQHGPDDPRIGLIHTVLIEPELPHVSDLADRCCLNQRTLERLCRKHFGFPPKLLLRRQRFMRSLAQFMLDPSLGWIGAIDSLYFDQSHFVRDCKTFLGVSPSEYAATEHPVMNRFLQERMRAHGSAVQTLDDPG